MNNLHWEILTKNDILISELDNTFLKDTRQIKMCYFTDGNNFYGVKDNLHFFINHKIFDFKLKQNILNYFQYKSVKYNLMTNKEEISYNVGLDTEDNKYQYKYLMTINENGVSFEARKLDNKEIISSKVIQLV